VLELAEWSCLFQIALSISPWRETPRTPYIGTKNIAGAPALVTASNFLQRRPTAISIGHHLSYPREDQLAAPKA
jgi:hypothetical protein